MSHTRLLRNAVSLMNHYLHCSSLTFSNALLTRLKLHWLSEREKCWLVAFKQQIERPYKLAKHYRQKITPLSSVGSNSKLNFR